MNVCEHVAASPYLTAERERERAAMAVTLAEARRSVRVVRMGAGGRGGLLGVAVALLVWPFAHMKM